MYDIINYFFLYFILFIISGQIDIFNVNIYIYILKNIIMEK
jgi:hypothetical protein